MSFNARWMSDLVRRYATIGPEFDRIVGNIGWLFFDKFLRMALGLLVGVWVARYLGPDQFGLLNFSLAYVALFGLLANLGLNTIVVRDLVQLPKETDVTLATAFVLQFVAGVLTYLLSVAMIAWLRPEDTLLYSIVALMSFCLVVRSTEVIRYWFESQVRSKYPIWVGNAAFLVIVVTKSGLIVLHAPLMAFVWAVLVEALLIAIGLLYIYSKTSGLLPVTKFQIKRAKTLLNDSWPLILSGVAVMIYMRTDQLMLGAMMGNEVVGVYSAANQLSEAWYFIPMAIVASISPLIIRIKKQDERLYQSRLQNLFDLLVVIAVFIALPVSIFSDRIIDLLYGDAYAETAQILSVQIWSSLFVFLGVASSNWFLLQNLQRLDFYRTALGAFTNVIANIMLIPEYGAVGAAFGTLVSQIVAAYISDLLSSRTRPLFWMKSASLFPIIRITRIRM